MENRIAKLESEVAALRTLLEQQQSANSIPLAMEQALIGRGFSKIGSLTGILRSIGTVLSAIAPKTGVNTYYVAAGSGGPVTTAITFTNGVLTS